MINTDKFYNDQIACAKELNFLFKKLCQFHHRMSKQLEDMKHVVISHEEVKAWKYGESGNSPAVKLYTCLYTWGNMERDFINRSLEREIDKNLAEGNEGYFEFIKNTFANQWDYVKNFKESLALYINDNSTALSVIDKLAKPPQKFNKDEFRRAIELDMIHIFDVAELVYRKHDKAYITFFKESDLLHRPITNPDFIPLDYKDNDKALAEIFKVLHSEKYINCTFEDFTSHFNPFAPRMTSKIVWLGSNVQLMALFQGKYLKTEERSSSKKYILRIKKEITHNDLMKHFKLKNKEFSSGSLRTGASNMNKTDEVYGFEPLVYLIDYLESVTND